MMKFTHELDGRQNQEVRVYSNHSPPHTTPKSNHWLSKSNYENAQKQLALLDLCISVRNPQNHDKGSVHSLYHQLYLSLSHHLRQNCRRDATERSKSALTGLRTWRIVIAHHSGFTFSVPVRDSLFVSETFWRNLIGERKRTYTWLRTILLLAARSPLQSDAACSIRIRCRGVFVERERERVPW